MVQGGLNIGVGNTAAGSIVQLVAKGAMDKYLTDNASRTYWKGKYEKVTQFAMESVIQSFNSQVQFGATSQITLNRTGDLVYYMYVIVELPGIRPVRMDGQSGMNMRAQFPSGNGQGIKKADAAVYADYCVESDISMGAEEVSSAGVMSALKKGKARWLQEKYAAVSSATAARTTQAHTLMSS